MNNKNTGGPAFPQTEVDRDGVTVTHQSGMTMRDYFAAKAMPAILEQNDVHDGRALVNASWIAYQMADAMLSARGTGKRGNND